MRVQLMRALHHICLRVAVSALPQTACARHAKRDQYLSRRATPRSESHSFRRALHPVLGVRSTGRLPPLRPPVILLRTPVTCFRSRTPGSASHPFFIPVILYPPISTRFPTPRSFTVASCYVSGGGAL